MTVIEDYNQMKQTLATAHRAPENRNYCIRVWPEHKSRKALDQMVKMAWDETNELVKDYDDGKIEGFLFEYKMKVLQDLKDSIEVIKLTGRR